MSRSSAIVLSQSLLFVTSSEIRVLEGGDRARFSSFTFGMLGLARSRSASSGRASSSWAMSGRAAGSIRFQRAASRRRVTSKAQQWLLNDVQTHRNGLPEVKVTLAGSAGYLTETSVALVRAMGTHSVAVVELFARAGRLHVCAARAGERLQWTQSG